MRPEEWLKILDAAADEVTMFVEAARTIAETQFGEGIASDSPEVVTQLAAMIQIALRQKLEAH